MWMLITINADLRFYKKNYKRSIKYTLFNATDIQIPCILGRLFTLSKFLKQLHIKYSKKLRPLGTHSINCYLHCRNYVKNRSIDLQ